ncbi:3-oxoacyl-acyl-carrier-protein reductase FabG [Tepidimonas thermarum]|uniref:3-oxoacyl-acyl-carrier-protein reductase FabG n=1 Tax=Tepidimonas thermarum TaxID=335431 RepID=A0A554X8B5_9BURK|nr:SDR family oxidoreductase [Tepidimonas thermarum]TSE32071.1 3-oxoacyl-acyl-carrier-protein reductase FabG [Tepidimonas thermarum]
MDTSHTPPERIALVTGAGSGIGRACALALLQDGWTVWLVGRRAAALQASIEHAAAQAPALRARAHPYVADVGDPEAVQALFDAVRARHGRLDLLFNNAGVFTLTATPDATTLEHWHQAVQTNLHGAFYCLRAAFGLMRTQSPRGGRIINNGSISAHTPRPGSIAYTATKHAITGLTKAAALDGRAFDIAVGQIDIGNVASDMTAAMAAGVLQADGSIRPEARMGMDAVVQTFMAMVRLPLQANVLFTTVMATQMPFVGRG